MTTVNIITDNDADFHRTFQYVTVTTLTPIDISGCAMVMMLRRHAADATAVLRLGTDTGEITIVDPVNGLFSVLIDQPTLEKLGAGDFDHSNIMTPVGGGKVKIWSGLLTNNWGATR